MKHIEWQKPDASETGLLENPGQGKSFNDPLEVGDLVKLRASGKYVQVRVEDIANPQAIVGEVALTNDSDTLNELELSTYDPVQFAKDQIFVRVFGE